MQLQDSVAVVTGGASGLGAACVKLLVENGTKVVIADRDTDKGSALVAEIGDPVRFVETDITDEAAVQVALDAAMNDFGGLHMLINCAGIGMAMKTYSSRGGAHPLDVFKAVINVNLIGTFNVIRLAAEMMIGNSPNEEGERGVIINTASVAAYDGQIGQAAYSASKGGIVGMTLPIARDLADKGIRVMTIAPGIFDTPLLAALPEKHVNHWGNRFHFLRAWAGRMNLQNLHRASLKIRC